MYMYMQIIKNDQTCINMYITNQNLRWQLAEGKIDRQMKPLPAHHNTPTILFEWKIKAVVFLGKTNVVILGGSVVYCIGTCICLLSHGDWMTDLLCPSGPVLGCSNRHQGYRFLRRPWHLGNGKNKPKHPVTPPRLQSPPRNIGIWPPKPPFPANKALLRAALVLP